MEKQGEKVRNLFVIDCSVTMGWCLLDEHSLYSEQVLQEALCSHIVVPSIWPYEVANVLNYAKQKKRVDSKQVAQFQHLLNQLPLKVEQTERNRIIEAVLLLAEKQDLSVYDAAYLELAKREKAILATLDKALHKAAIKEKVQLFTVQN